jgi:hypothetical protein
MSNSETAMHPGDEIKLDAPVITVIRQRPISEAVASCEDWLKEIIPVARAPVIRG